MNPTRTLGSNPIGMVTRKLGLAFLSDAGAVTFPLRAGRQVIGRARECDVAVEDVSMSRRHAEITLGEKLTIVDLGSANGTRVRLTKPQADGDETVRSAASLKPVEAQVPHELSVGSVIEFGSALAIIIEETAQREPLSFGEDSDAHFISPSMSALRETCLRVAPTEISVLILGETGAGKEVIATLIHRASQRKGALIVVNCAAIPAQLFESELFGHERGSFTGASEKKRGLLEHAEHGTVFLDEIGEMPLDAQAKLLRFLAEKRFRTVGGANERALDVRVVAATNRDLEAECRRGTFREDLYYRLSTISLAVPALRTRRDEIVPLATRFLEAACRRYQRAPAPTLSEAGIAALMTHGWAGNVRELKSRIERAAILTDGSSIEPRHLGFDSEPQVTPPVSSSSRDLHGMVEELERERIVWALEACEGNQTKAAVMLGISRRMLVHRLEVFSLPRPRKKS